MKARKCIAPSSRPRHNRNERLKDEVYRQMFRLEATRPGAEMGLALALLHAWTSAASRPEGGGEREWLTKISPICLSMIEASLDLGKLSNPCPQ